VDHSIKCALIEGNIDRVAGDGRHITDVCLPPSDAIELLRFHETDHGWREVDTDLIPVAALEQVLGYVLLVNGHGQRTAVALLCRDYRYLRYPRRPNAVSWAGPEVFEC